MKRNTSAEEAANEQREECAPETEETETPVQEEKEDAAQEELKKQKELYLRLAAEYDNFRKRTQREKEALSADIKADCVAELLPVIDNIERALAADTPDDDPLRKGVEMVMNQTVAAFEKMGVTSFGDPGDEFDPRIHHCVSTTDSDEFESGKITLVMQRGYRLGDKIVRPAMVQTAN